MVKEPLLVVVTKVVDSLLGLCFVATFSPVSCGWVVGNKKCYDIVPV